ncbi:Acetylgalactosaminyl-O-glycosyl-glycoprotein beta-1,3-N-acetylglucosaminyltransferase [Aquarana catesbeiana]|uniref:Hexosyltransferase n=1 Tax=Aquarana catesbeiana TaxID=8400 RepID=A0A2G9QBW9_AQUCT|nr:Acetylgalactosaminyl-O-glycosyl-glycoprotein beta-1,3-N-acetylglucosaminyltransferase [Aquarana catesbeiana]
MKHKVIFKRAFLFSIVTIVTFLIVRRSKNTRDIPQIMCFSPTPTRMPLPIKRQSVTLYSGTYTYHLNLTRFEAEFPYLQSYHCTLIQEPNQEKQGATNQKLLILAVKSQPSTGTRRLKLRKTWAKEREINGYRIKPLFLLGKTDVEEHMEMAKHESRVYGDILQWDMTEGHHNLSLKERCFLEWLFLKSPQVDHIFKVDDDEFVNPDVIVQYITEYGSPNTIHGFHYHRPPVLRGTKYSISKNLYPQQYYPGFVSGGGFLFPGASVNGLYNASLLLPVFPLDDVYFGFLTVAANLTFRHDRRFYVRGLKYDVCRYKEALVVHGINAKFMTLIWREVQNSECHKVEVTSS